MKKLIIILLFLILYSTAQAATRTIDSDATNWSAGTSWVEGVAPTASDTVVANASSASITIDTTTCVASTMVLTNYTGTMTFGAGNKLTVTTTVTFVSGMTLSGTGTLQLSVSATITSGGLTFPGSIIFDGGTWTLADAWTVTGSATSQTSAVILNAQSLAIGGSLTLTGANITGTTALTLNGTGTWSSSVSSATIANNLTINTAGTITLGTNVGYLTGTLTYTSGTIVNTDSTLNLTGSSTLNTSGMTWNNISCLTASTITLTSNLTCGGVLRTAGLSISFAGSYDISCATLRIDIGATITLVASRTLTASTNLWIQGGGSSTTTIRSSISSTATNLTFQGTSANQIVSVATFTDINASGSAQGIDNWYGGTLTRTTNIINRTSSSINDLFGVIN